MEAVGGSLAIIFNTIWVRLYGDGIYIWTVKLTLSETGFSRVPGPGWEEGGEGGYISETVHGIEMKFGRVVENHRLINLG